MPENTITNRKPSVAISVAIFIAAVTFMGLLRFVIFRQDFLALTYGLPLLFCLWHRDRTLLWLMSGAFIIMAAVKAFFLMPLHAPYSHVNLVQWSMQVCNILIIGGTVNYIIILMERIRHRNAQLEQANEEIGRQNEELQAQSEQLAQQNEELHSQGEELAQQNVELQQQAEELQQQSEEVGQQSEELAAQSEEVQALNAELSQRESMLQAMLVSLKDAKSENEVLSGICQTLARLLSDAAVGAAVLERENGGYVVRTCIGPGQVPGTQRPSENSFAALVQEQNRTAFIDDVTARPDLVCGPAGCGSVLATPLLLNGLPAGIVEAYSLEPRQWTDQHFRIMEWVAVQCALALQIIRLRDEVSRARNELAATNASLEKLVQERTAKLRETVEELEHFSYTITHDMRAPLRAMQGFAGMMKELAGPDINPEMDQCLRHITTSTRRMDVLITDALAYSQAVRQELNLTRVDCAALLRGMVESYPDFQPPKAKIEIDGAIPPVLGNEAGLTQCFSNLLGNAVKFVAPGAIPQVKIRAEKIDGAVRIWFEDNGIGIPEPARARLFRMFQRVSKDYEGTGIGLALVRKTAQQMGGRVGVESELGKGSRFWLELQPYPHADGSAGPHHSKRDGAVHVEFNRSLSAS